MAENQPEMKEVEDAITALLDQRKDDQTICPSEVARMLAMPDGDWRANMNSVHEAVDAMLASGTVTITWKGVRKEQRRGAYRIARRRPLPTPNRLTP